MACDMRTKDILLQRQVCCPPCRQGKSIMSAWHRQWCGPVRIGRGFPKGVLTDRGVHLEVADEEEPLLPPATL
jgi:hypothetical protein